MRCKKLYFIGIMVYVLAISYVSFNMGYDAGYDDGYYLKDLIENAVSEQPEMVDVTENVTKYIRMNWSLGVTNYYEYSFHLINFSSISEYHLENCEKYNATNCYYMRLEYDNRTLNYTLEGFVEMFEREWKVKT